MVPVGDKVVLEKVELPDTERGLHLSGGGTVFAKVVAVGAGIPYGRGEFYEPVLKEGDLVFLPLKDWDQAPFVRLSLGGTPRMLRVLHERQILVQVNSEDL